MTHHQPTPSPEAQLKQLGRILAATNENHRSLLQATREEDWLKQVCKIIARQGEYPLVWIGYGQAAPPSVVPAAHAGFDGQPADLPSLLQTQSAQRPDPATTAIQTGKPDTMRHIHSDPSLAAWRKTAKHFGFGSSISLPLALEGQVIGALNIYSKTDDAFDEAETRQLGTLAEGIAFGMTCLREKAARQQAEDVAQQSQALSNQLLNTVQAIIVLLDPQGKILYINAYMETLSGYTLDEVKGKDWFATFLPESERTKIRQVFSSASKGKSTKGNINPIITKDGKERLIQWYDNALFDESSQSNHLLSTGIDITDQEADFHNLLQSQHRFRTVIDTLPQGIFLKDLDSTYLTCNQSHASMLGLASPKDIIGCRDEDFFPPELAKKYQADDQKVLQSRKTIDIEEASIKDGQEIVVQTVKTPMYDEHGSPIGTLGIYWDITERKRTEQALAEHEHKLRLLFDNMSSAFALHEIICDDEGKPVDYRFLEANQAFETLTGIPVAKLIGKTARELLPGLEAFWVERYGKVALSGKPATIQEYSEPLKRYYDVRAFSPKKGQFATVFNDITEQKESELALSHANRALRTLSTVNHELVHADNEHDLLQAICKAIVEQQGYRMAWVGYPLNDEKKTTRIMASAGDNTGVLEQLHPDWSEGPNGNAPSGRAIRTGQTQVARELALDSLYFPWKAALLRAGCIAALALPLKDHDKTFGVLNVYASEPDAFVDKELALLEEMAADLAFGVLTVRLRAERDKALKMDSLHLGQLHQNLNETVLAIAKAVEARDPYTAGHQLRVADLAMAIGHQLGLSEDMIEGLKMGATIHDIGKIHVPAEILSKPSRLTEVEYLIIKQHPAVGYEILRDIHFPWPIADIAHQHHERMDGSGYPQGLKGEEICLEARIITVADVVEAMNSHRPYRPGFGMEAAIDEITQNRGSLYDAKIVDACLQVIENGFNFKVD